MPIRGTKELQLLELAPEIYELNFRSLFFKKSNSKHFNMFNRNPYELYDQHDIQVPFLLLLRILSCSLIYVLTI